MTRRGKGRPAPKPKSGPKWTAKGRFDFYSRLKQIGDEKTRNLIRGKVSAQKMKRFASSAITDLKKSAHPDDLAIATELLIGSNGAFPNSGLRFTSGDLIRLHNLDEVKAEQEVLFLAGRLNGWRDEVLAILEVVLAFSRLPEAEPQDAIDALTMFAERWGASNYLIKKVAFISSKSDQFPEIHPKLNKLFGILKHREASGPYFSAMEALDVDFPYFSGIRTRIQVYKKYLREDFRQVISLFNYCPSPFDESDISPFLRKCFSMSLVDEVVAAIQIHISSERWPFVSALLKEKLDSGIWEKINEVSLAPFDTSALFSDISASEADFALYRRSIAFVEFAEPALFRRAIDDVLVPRLLDQRFNPDRERIRFETSAHGLTKQPLGFKSPSDMYSEQSVGRFLRTIHFLAHLQKQPHTSFDQHQLRKIFSQTRDLDILMSEDEIERLYALSDEESRPVITILALALHKARGHDEDVDFKFRFSFSNTILSRFGGKIESFIQWLLPASPEIARYFLMVLDRQTLQKLYWIIPSADEADRVRQALLRLVGTHTNEIAFIVEADSIEAERQVSKLRTYLDESRLYVDGVELKKWMVENPSSYAQQYQRLIDHRVSSITATTVRIKDGQLTEVGTTKIDIPGAFDYILAEAAKIIFNEFCTNANFGIESYLGRRIRHNTLSGMMRAGVEQLIDQPRYTSLTYDEEFCASLDEFLLYYKETVEYIRRDLLQFRNNNKPNGLFNSDLDVDSELIKQDVVALRNNIQALRSQDMFHELIIRFCWSEIDPQISRASRYITVDLLKAVLKKEEEFLGRFEASLEVSFRSQLRDEVHQRFTRLGSWFRQPNSGFVAASPKRIGNLIHVESLPAHQNQIAPLRWEGDAVDTVLDGLSVHRVYDCLFVLLRNAFKYGAEEQACIRVTTQTAAHNNVARFSFEVSSTLPHVDRTEHINRLSDSFKHTELKASMASEGYSGIRKLRFITQSSERKETAGYRIEGDVCVVFFTLTVEIADESDHGDAHLAS